MTDTPDEAEMRAALDSGDAVRIAAATADVDALEVPKLTPSLLGAALWYAEQGLKVFPLSPGSKFPFKGSNGFHGASANPEVIRGWWTDSPDANIGIPTGHAFDVVDIDGPIGQAHRAREWEARFAQIDADSMAKVLTPRMGGMHIYVPPQGDKNRTHIYPGIDYRGSGGYVLAPPSQLVAGKCGPDDTPGTYRFLGTPNLAGLVAERVS